MRACFLYVGKQWVFHCKLSVLWDWGARVRALTWVVPDVGQELSPGAYTLKCSLLSLQCCTLSAWNVFTPNPHVYAEMFHEFCMPGHTISAHPHCKTQLCELVKGIRFFRTVSKICLFPYFSLLFFSISFVKARKEANLSYARIVSGTTEINQQHFTETICKYSSTFLRLITWLPIWPLCKYSVAEMILL